MKEKILLIVTSVAITIAVFAVMSRATPQAFGALSGVWWNTVTTSSKMDCGPTASTIVATTSVPNTRRYVSIVNNGTTDVTIEFQGTPVSGEGHVLKASGGSLTLDASTGMHEGIITCTASASSSIAYTIKQ